MTNLRAFTMPKWGIEMTEGTIAEWMVAEGERFAKGDVIALIETDKITNEFAAEFDGSLARIVAETGTTYPVGALLAVFALGETTDSEIEQFLSTFRPADTSTASRGAPKASTPPAPVGTSHAPRAAIPDDVAISPAARTHAEALDIDVGKIAGSGRGGRITFQDVDQASRPPRSVGNGKPVSVTPSSDSLDRYFASPMAKRLAVLHDVDLTDINGTGPRGRICKQDVLTIVEARQPAAAPAEPDAGAASHPAAVIQPAPSFARPVEGVTEVIKMSPMRKAIARQLSHSKSTIPHFYLRMQVQVDTLLAMRERAKQSTGEAPSINDYLIRAVALALKQHPDVNIQVHGDEIHRFATADIAVAVATDKGLLTPILHAADSKSVARISAEVKMLAERARANKLQPEEFQGGSFSISNLGMFGIDQFDAIINPPQGAILAVGATRRQPTETAHALSFATTMQLSLSCDHRAIDGALGAKFMATLRNLIEGPAQLTK